MQLRASYTPTPSVSLIKHVANFSGFLSDYGYLRRNIPSFTGYRYFKFTRASKDGSKFPFLTHLSVQLNNIDSWIAFPASIEGTGFLAPESDLSETPPTLLKSPGNYNEVTKRFESMESKVADKTKMKEQFNLRD